MSEFLFTYGTLQDKNIQLDLFQRILKGNTDHLKGFDKSNIKLGNKYYPILSKSNSTNTLILGKCYALTKVELQICDEYEGESYTRIKVILESNQEAWVYIKA